MRILLILTAFLLISLSVLADYLIGGDPGFGLFQLLLLLGGIAMLAKGTIFWHRFNQLVSVKQGRVGFIAIQFQKGPFFAACMAVMVFVTLEVISGIGLSYLPSPLVVPDSSLEFWRENFGPPIFNDVAIADAVYQDLEANLTTGYMPYYEWRADPNQTLKTISVNSAGFRGPPIRPQRDQVRVLLCGGSVAWGYGATKEENTLRACLERELARRFPEKEWEVISMAERAYVLRQERIRFELEGLAFKADYAIFIDGFNDSNAMLTSIRLGDHFRTKQFTEQLKSFKKKKSTQPGSDQSQEHASPLTGSKFNTLRLIGELAAKLDHVDLGDISNKVQPDTPSGTPADLVSHMKSEISFLDSLAANHSMRIAMVLQPVIYTKSKLSENDERLLQYYRSTRGEDHLQNFRNCYDSLRGFYGQKSAGEKTTLLDHSHIFDEEPVVFFDYCHISDVFYKQWATQLVDDLVAAGWFDDAPNAVK